MMTKSIVKALLIIACLLVCDLLTGAFLNTGMLLPTSAEARVGRPRTPTSVAGVARRTTRRRIRRTTTYVAVLPPKHTTVVISGTTLYQSGNTYYQLEGKQYIVVTVD